MVELTIRYNIADIVLDYMQYECDHRMSSSVLYFLLSLPEKQVYTSA